MIDVKWNDNAKAAVDYFADWLRADYNYIANLEYFYRRLPQTKTVADAVEWAKGEWNATSYQYIVYNPSLDRFDYSKTGDINEKWYKVCTSAEFEDYVKEQEGEKWTHITSLGRCRVLIDTPDKHGYLVVELDGQGYSLCFPSSLKPIKPTLTKAQAWDKMAYDFNPSLMYESIMQNYDITD